MVYLLLRDSEPLMLSDIRVLLNAWNLLGVRGVKEKTKNSQKHTETFTLLKRSPHRRTGGAVTVANAASVLNSAGLHHIVAANLLQHKCKTGIHNVLPEDKKINNRTEGKLAQQSSLMSAARNIRFHASCSFSW